MTDRRGFLATVFAAVLARFAPKRKPVSGVQTMAEARRVADHTFYKLPQDLCPRCGTPSVCTTYIGFERDEKLANICHACYLKYYCATGTGYALNLSMDVPGSSKTIELVEPDDSRRKVRLRA